MVKPIADESTEPNIGDALNSIVRDGLPPFAKWLAIFYSALSMIHPFAQPTYTAKWAMTIISFASAILLFGLRVTLNRVTVPLNYAHPIAALIVSIALFNCTANFYFIPIPQQSTNFMLVIIGAGLFFLSTRWVVATFVVTFITWISIASLAIESYEWRHFLFAMLTTTTLSAFIHRARIQAYSNLENKRIKLAQAVKVIEASKIEADKRNEELNRKNQDLIESNQRADRIFSALAQALPGTVLDGKYRLDEKIGAGGFGAVYRATHLSMKRTIAVKVFKPASGNDSAEGLDRFQQEAVSACRINHPNAVAVLDSGISTEGIAYLVMELLEGHSLKTELKEKKILSLNRCAQIIIPVCDVLWKAHTMGIVHRDIKPDNIFLHQSEQGEIVKVVDFGIAKLMDANSYGLDKKDLTATGGLIGTPNYMSPERFDGRLYDGKSDVYSVGIMLYEMLCGKELFSSVNGFGSLMMQHLYTAPSSIRESNLSVPEELEAIVMRALEKDPNKRPTAKELAEEFAMAVGVDLETRSTGFKLLLNEELNEEDESEAKTISFSPEKQEAAIGPLEQLTLIKPKDP